MDFVPKMFGSHVSVSVHSPFQELCIPRSRGAGIVPASQLSSRWLPAGVFEFFFRRRCLLRPMPLTLFLSFSSADEFAFLPKPC